MPLESSSASAITQLNQQSNIPTQTNLCTLTSQSITLI